MDIVTLFSGSLAIITSLYTGKYTVNHHKDLNNLQLRLITKMSDSSLLLRFHLLQYSRNRHMIQLLL